MWFACDDASDDDRFDDSHDDSHDNSHAKSHYDTDAGRHDNSDDKTDGNSDGNSDGNGNGGFWNGIKDDDVTMTYHSRLIEVLQHKRFIDIIMNKELAPKEKDGNYNSNKIGGYRRGKTVDNITIAYHSRFNEVIWKRKHSNFHGIEYRHNLSQRNMLDLD